MSIRDLWLAVEDDSIDLVKSLLENDSVKKHINEGISDNESTFLHLACEKGYAETSSVLLEAGARCDVKNALHDRPIHCAASKGRTDCVKLLLTKDSAQINLLGNNGWTPLHYATYNQHQAIVKVLLNEEGVDTEVIDNEGLTALHWASLYGDLPTVQLLVLLGGADINATVCEREESCSKHINKTSVQLARDNDHSDVADYLKNLLTTGMFHYSHANTHDIIRELVVD